VTVPQKDEAVAVRRIHELGAKAFRYIQFFWFPEGRKYEGINISRNINWAFCKDGATPRVGRETPKAGGGTEKWYFIDGNEKGVQAAAAASLQQVKEAGWDGVMFDRGYAALTGSEPAVAAIWAAKSTCTNKPTGSGRTFADGYLDLVAQAKPKGLDVLLNYGRSPFDTLVPMRPDPANPACQRHDWASCRPLSDVWDKVALVLDEAPAHPHDEQWDADFVANQRNEQDPAHGGNVVTLITEGTLGKGNYNKANVYFQWARIKLFNLPIAVGTGSDGCISSATGKRESGICNRQGAFPELTDLALGHPLSPQPTSQACDAGSKIHCVWQRTYSSGVVVVNPSPSAKTVTVALGTTGCRKVKDIATGQAIEGGKCVTTVTLEMAAWSGHPLQFT
jgi:hypothetical protein